jgi:hypothetical protein
MRLSEVPPDVRTVYLGQFTHGHAVLIAERLEAKNIVWWSKQPGFLSQVWERGVRLFVDRARLAEAELIAERVLAEKQPNEPTKADGDPNI